MTQTELADHTSLLVLLIYGIVSSHHHGKSCEGNVQVISSDYEICFIFLFRAFAHGNLYITLRTPSDSYSHQLSHGASQVTKLHVSREYGTRRLKSERDPIWFSRIFPPIICDAKKTPLAVSVITKVAAWLFDIYRSLWYIGGTRRAPEIHTEPPRMV